MITIPPDPGRKAKVVSVTVVGVAISLLTTARQMVRTSPSTPVLLGLVNATSGYSVRGHMTIT